MVRAVQAIEKLKGDNEDQNHGIAMLRKAMEAPLRQIVDNAGGEPSVVVNRVKGEKGAYGYDAAREDYCDLIEAAS